MTENLKKIWTIFTVREQRQSVLMLVLVVLMALVETLGVLSIMPFLSVLGRPAVIHENAFLSEAYKRLNFQGTRDFILALGLASIVLVMASSIFKTVTQHVLNRFVHLLRHAISSRLLSRYLHQPYEFFLSRNPSALGKNVLSEVDQLMFQLVQPLSQLLAQGCVVLAMAVLIFVYDPLTATCIIVALGLMYGAIYGFVRKRLGIIGHERATANGQRYQACNEALGGIKDVKITHSAGAYQQQFEQASRQLSRHMATGDTLSQSPLYLVEAAGYSMLIVIAMILLLRSNDIAHILPALGLYGFAAYRMLPAAQVMYRGFAKLKFSSSALQSIHRDLILPEVPVPAVESPLEPLKEIRLQGIRYAYPSAPYKAVLDGFDLTIRAHTSVGIVGKSGAGKSTLMDLLLGLLQPQAGTISVDGIPITADNVTAWQRAIGYVPQHIYLADTSVVENIAFGVARESIDMGAVESAARAAQIHGFIVNELPDGYDTKIGDRGTRLSGGQRQRVGIARALYRDPMVLFFDEATSALDAQTEATLNEAISHLSGQKTIVVIAHKEASLRNFHSIVTLAHGAQTNATSNDLQTASKADSPTEDAQRSAFRP
jgi:ABC-type multidrug transport system fused ATPase/permease subunit